MPIYEYQCLGCGKKFEIFQKITDEPLKQCRICNGTLQKLISNCAFHLKGTGWYVTDYKKPVDTANGKRTEPKKPATEAKAETASETKTETKTETKADTKTATKSESVSSGTQSQTAGG